SLDKHIHDNFGIVEGLMITVYAITATTRTMDGTSKELYCDSCGVAQITIPVSTSIAETVGKVISVFNGKLTGIAFCVPMHNLSVMVLSCHLEKAAKYDDIKKVVNQALEGPPIVHLGLHQGTGCLL
ncbi:Hypothetical predicted protein, partial [Marmota monax]